MGPAKLWPMEQTCIREAADTLLFCTDLKHDPAAREALSEVAILSDDLIHAGRWTPQRIQRLIDDIWACGPGEALEVRVAA
jgi:hypothetical protein